MTSKELRELQIASEPRKDISVPRYEGRSAIEAAKIAKELLNRENLNDDEARQLVACQQIADKGGVLIDEIKDGPGPFLNDHDMLANKENEK